MNLITEECFDQGACGVKLAYYRDRNGTWSFESSCLYQTYKEKLKGKRLVAKED